MAIQEEEGANHIIRVDDSVWNRLRGKVNRNDVAKILSIITAFYSDVLRCCLDPAEFVSRGRNSRVLFDWLMGASGSQLTVIGAPFKLIVERANGDLAFSVVEIQFPN